MARTAAQNQQSSTTDNSGNFPTLPAARAAAAAHHSDSDSYVHDDDMHADTDDVVSNFSEEGYAPTEVRTFLFN
jgi:hypothetical protein